MSLSKKPQLFLRFSLTNHLSKRHAHVVLPQNKSPSDPILRRTTTSAAATTVNRLLNTFTETPEDNSSLQPEKDEIGEVDPELSVIGSGTSSAVLVRLPATSGAKILAVRGTVLGKSPGVVSRLSVEENVLAAVRGRVVIYEELSCTKGVKTGNGDVLLAPKRPWDAIATMTLDGRNELQLRASALLARSGRVVLLGSGNNTSGMNIMSRLFSYKLTGRGTVAITASGGLHKVVLGKDEEYMVDSRRMVAWDAHTSTAPALSRFQPLEFSKGPTKEKTTSNDNPTSSSDPNTNEKTNTDVRSIATSGMGSSISDTLNSPRVVAMRETVSRLARVVWAMGSKWTRELLLGRGDYVKLTGPGVVYLAGRRGITGLERFGVGLDWVARNLPSLPTKPSETHSRLSSTPPVPDKETHQPTSNTSPLNEKPTHKSTRSNEPGTSTMSDGIGMKVVDYGSQLNNKPVLGPAINKRSKRE